MSQFNVYCQEKGSCSQNDSGILLWAATHFPMTPESPMDSLNLTNRRRKKVDLQRGISLCLYSVVSSAVSQPFLLKEKAKKCRLAVWPVQFSTVAQSCPTVCDPMDCSTPDFPVHHQLPELTQTHDHRFSDAIQPSHPLLLLPSILPSIRVFSSESILCIRWSKYWSFSISPSNEHSGLISCRMDWLDLLAVQGTLKSLLQHFSSKSSIFWCSAFFTVQLSHPYMTTSMWLAEGNAFWWRVAFFLRHSLFPWRSAQHYA